MPSYIFVQLYERMMPETLAFCHRVIKKEQAACIDKHEYYASFNAACIEHLDV